MLNLKLLNKKRGHIFMLSFLFLYLNTFSQHQKFSDVLTFKENVEIKGLSNNPYKLITECFFSKTLNNEVIWGNDKLNSNYFFNSLNLETNKISEIKIDLLELKNNISVKDYNDLIYYGFSTVIKTKAFTLFNVGNNLYVFNHQNNKLLYKRTIVIPDTIGVNNLFANSDTSLILLDYRASFNSNKKIKACQFNINTSEIKTVFEEDMGSNSACYDRANTRYYDAIKNYFLITDNLDYKIYLFGNNSKKLMTYYKALSISEKSRATLNPQQLKTHTLDSIAYELDNTPRIINTQFLNDTDIIVNYAIKSNIEKNGIKIKNSTIDLLTIRNDSIIYKNTFDDTFFYEQIGFKKTDKVNQKEMNPYLRSELFHLVLNNHLIKITFKQLIPKTKTSFDKYIRTAKFSILNLKSNLIYSLYDFHY